MATNIGTIELIATVDTSQYKKGVSDIDRANKQIESSTDDVSTKSNRSFLSVAKVGLAALATAAVSAGAAIIANVGGAIRRVDTLNNSTRVFENMGFASDTVRKSMDALEKSIKGLPTPLDSAVRGMTSLASTYGDVGLGQKVFTALNNAILGFGGTAFEVDNAIQQLSQLPMDGPLDAQTWNSLRNSGLTPVLVAIAKDMGMGINEMKEAFGEGQLTVQDFTDALIKMNTDGAGGMKSLEKIVKDQTGGIGTSFANMGTAMARGIAIVIDSIGSENIARSLASIGKAFESALGAVASSIQWLKQYDTLIRNIAIAITGALIPAVARFTVLQAIAGAQALVAGARMAAAWLLALGPIGIIIALVGAAAALIIANFDNVKAFVIDVWKNITNAVSSAFEWIRSNWPLLLAILTGPIGLAVLAIVRNFDAIKQAVQSVKNWITGAFSTIGDIGAAIIKGSINSVLGFAERTINGFINLINGALSVINKIPGVNIGKIGNLSIPRLAEGGIVSSPTLAMIGEGNESEAVIPLSKLDSIMAQDRAGNNTNSSQITINISGTFATSPAERRRVAEQIQKALLEAQEQRKGISWQLA